MSVFTELERAQLEIFVADYNLGELKDFRGIAAGTENSNFFVSLEGGEYVLTLIERGDAQDLPFFIDLLERLHQAELPVPYAITTRDGETLRQLADKPALLQPRLAGGHIDQPNAHHCEQIGNWLARMHLATCEQPLQKPSDRGLDWMLQVGSEYRAQLDASGQALLDSILAEGERLSERLKALPKANLHADLFRDNVLFDGSQLSGVIDFYNACSGPMLYDLAITLNDWCSDATQQIEPQRAHALLNAYATLRPFTVAEVELWPTMLRIACLRFWISRLIAAQEFAGRDVLIKDPSEFQQRLAQRQQVSIKLPLTL